MTAIEESICKLDECLANVPQEFAFLGGSVLSLLVTDPDIDAIRVTKDVDIMMNIRNRREYHKADRMLEKLGFKHDTREDAPICRWIYEGITVDVLPIHEDVLGWNSRFFDEALATAEEKVIGTRHIRIVSAPYFVALKIEAFEDRGKSDFLMSSDFEDVICLFNGRESIVKEIESCKALRMFLADKFSAYLKVDELVDAVDGFVQTELQPELRKQLILNRFKAVAEMK